MLALTIVAIATLTFATTVKFDQAMIVAIPFLAVIAILYIKHPEIGFSAFLVGQNLFAIPLLLVNSENTLIIYPLMGAVLLSTFFLTLFYGKISLPRKISAIQISFLLIVLLFLLNLPRMEINAYTIAKSVLFVSLCINTFIVLHFWGNQTEFFEKSIDYALLLGIIPLVISGVSFFQRGGATQYVRFSALAINVNQYARNMGFMTILAFYKIFNSKKTIHQLLLMLFISASFAFIIFTGSRSAFLAAIIAIVFYLFVFTDVSLRKKVLLISVLSIPLALFAIMAIGSMFSRLGSLQYVDMSLTGRIGMWKAVWESRFDEVLFGHGTGNYSAILPAWAKGAKLQHLHNVIMEYYIEWGIIGLLCYLALLMSCFKTAVYFIKKRKNSSLFIKLGGLSSSLFLYTLMLAMIVTTSTDHLFFISIGLMSSMYIAHKEKDAHRDGSIGSSA
ncbi:O-antigen ligase family protein [bacterium]|nr:O-antigen ligase family protein [bacterium]